MSYLIQFITVPYKGLTNERNPLVNTKPASDSHCGGSGREGCLHVTQKSNAFSKMYLCVVIAGRSRYSRHSLIMDAKVLSLLFNISSVK